MYRILINVVQQLTHITVRLIGRIIHHTVKGIRLQAGKYLDGIGGIRQIECAGWMGFKVISIDELDDITEHTTVVHVVPIDQGIRIRQIPRVHARHKDRAIQRKVSINIGIDILHVILTDDNGIVDVGIVDGQPTKHIRVDGLEFLQRGVRIRVARGARLEGKQVTVQERAIVYHGRVPQGIPAEQQHQHDQCRGYHADQTVAGARQLGRCVQEGYLLW